MKCNTVLPGKAYWYYTTVNVLRILLTQTCTEDTRARRICFEMRMKQYNHWQAVSEGKLHPLNNLCVENRC